jgi:hypothetical protein
VECTLPKTASLIYNKAIINSSSNIGYTMVSDAIKSFITFNFFNSIYTTHYQSLNHDQPPTLNLHFTFASFSYYSKTSAKLRSKTWGQFALLILSLQIAHFTAIIDLSVPIMSHHLIHIFLPINFESAAVLQVSRIPFINLEVLVFRYFEWMLGLE